METTICTSIEQSKKLIEIGLDVNTADMYYYYPYGKFVRKAVIKTDEYHRDKSDVPAWSLSALFKLLPIFTEPTAFSVNVSAPFVIKTENGWLLKYDGDFTLKINNGKDTEAPFELLADNPIEAVFNMVVFLIENNYIETGKSM